MSHNSYLLERYNGKILCGIDSYNTEYLHQSPVSWIQKHPQYFINKHLKFIYPISYITTSEFLKEPPYLDSKVVEACNSGLCRVVMTFNTEGYQAGTEFLKWLEDFALKNKLNFTNFFFSHGNRKLAKSYLKYVNGKREPRVTILKYCFFQDFPWFLYNGRVSFTQKKELLEHYTKILANNREVIKVKHFLCLNRVPRTSRMLLFATIASNENLNSKTILSIGTGVNCPNNQSTYLERHPEASLPIKGWLHLHYEDEIIPPRLQNFINSYNWEEKKHVLDNSKDSNEAFGINFDYHQSTFLNIVTETLTDNNTVFFSEKIFKPIYMLQPFILLSSMHSLKELKTLGYKTFDRWWDESYDEESKLVDRILKIEKVLEKLSKLPLDELHGMTLAMEDTLVHNYSVFLLEPKQESLDYYNILSFNRDAPLSMKNELQSATRTKNKNRNNGIL